MNYHVMSKEELIAVLHEVERALGPDSEDPLGQDPVARAKRLVAGERMLLGKYLTLMVEYGMAFGIDGAALMANGLAHFDREEISGALRADLERFTESAKVRVLRAIQLAEAERQHAQRDVAFEQMINARKAAEILCGVPAQISVADAIMRAAGYEDTKRTP